MERRTVSFSETMGWPGVPGRRRFEKAMGIIQTGDQPTPDSLTLLRILDTPEYQRWAAARLQERMERTGETAWGVPGTLMISDGETQLVSEFGLEEIAARGSDSEFLGLLMILTPKDGPGKDTSLDPNAGIHFTRLHRDPHWMGFNGWLPLLKGLRMELHGQDGVPGVAKAVPQDFPKQRGGEDEMPGYEAQELAAIAGWHGASGFTWHEFAN